MSQENEQKDMLDDVERLKLALATERIARTKAQHDLIVTQIQVLKKDLTALEEAHKVSVKALMEKHNLTEEDSIDLDTGKISRKDKK